MGAYRSRGAEKRTEVRAAPWGSPQGHPWSVKHRVVAGCTSHTG